MDKKQANNNHLDKLVLQYLKNKGYKEAERALLEESHLTTLGIDPYNSSSTLIPSQDTNPELLGDTNTNENENGNVNENVNANENANENDTGTGTGTDIDIDIQTALTNELVELSTEGVISDNRLLLLSSSVSNTKTTTATTTATTTTTTNKTTATTATSTREDNEESDEQDIDNSSFSTPISSSTPIIDEANVIASFDKFFNWVINSLEEYKHQLLAVSFALFVYIYILLSRQKNLVKIKGKGKVERELQQEKTRQFLEKYIVFYSNLNNYYAQELASLSSIYNNQAFEKYLGNTSTKGGIGGIGDGVSNRYMLKLSGSCIQLLLNYFTMDNTSNVTITNHNHNHNQNLNQNQNQNQGALGFTKKSEASGGIGIVENLQGPPILLVLLNMYITLLKSTVFEEIGIVNSEIFLPYSSKTQTTTTSTTKDYEKEKDFDKENTNASDNTNASVVENQLTNLNSKNLQLKISYQYTIDNTNLPVVPPTSTTDEKSDSSSANTTNTNTATTATTTTTTTTTTTDTATTTTTTTGMGTGVPPPPPPSSSSSSLATETSNSVSTFSTGEFVLPITDTTQLDSISDQQILTPGSKLSMVSKVPLPPQKPSDKLRILHDLKDLYSSKRAIHVSSTNPPSICMFTLHNTICSTSNPSPNSNFNTIGSSGSGNSESTLTSTAISRDFDIVAAGFSDSYIKIWNINNNNNRDRDRDIDNENQQNTDSNLDTDNEYQKYKNKKLVAHSGPVYGLDIAHDNSLLVSSSADTTVRLWSLFPNSSSSYSSSSTTTTTATTTTFKSKSKSKSKPLDLCANLASYRGHNYPVWDVKFSPFSYYFATASYDRTARLYSVERINPLRLFAGHLSDVTTVAFHPNCNYLATGSDDTYVRLWDISSASCVRLLYPQQSSSSSSSSSSSTANSTNSASVGNNRGPVTCCKFSPNGKLLAVAYSAVSITPVTNKPKSKSKTQTHTKTNPNDQQQQQQEQQQQQQQSTSPSKSTTKSTTRTTRTTFRNTNNAIIVYDLSTSKPLFTFAYAHNALITSLDFNNESTVLLSSSIDNTIRAWDLVLNNSHNSNSKIGASNGINTSTTGGGSGIPSSPSSYNHSSPLFTWYTRNTPVYHLKFSTKNLCAAVGPFIP